MKILDLLSSEEACSRFFRDVRWRSSISCPRCGSVRMKGMGITHKGSNVIFVRLVGRALTIKLELYSLILG